MIPKRKLIVANWKMHKNIYESLELTQKIAIGIKRDDLDILICPTFPALFSVAQCLKNTSINVGAQNLYWEENGAFTGEVSGNIVKATGAKYVLIGHSERRQIFGETEQTIAKRLAAAWRANLEPILCVGEILEERKNGLTKNILEKQLTGALANATLFQANNLIIAYEPIWAIGAKKSATIDQINKVIAYIRLWITNRFNKLVANSTKILYGGNINLINASTILNQKEVDGALIGRASLNSTTFLDIIQSI